MERLGTQFPVQKGTNGLPTWRLCTSPDVTSLIRPGSSNGCPIDYPTLCKQVSYSRAPGQEVLGICICGISVCPPFGY